MKQKIKHIWRRAGEPLRRLWSWAKNPERPGRKADRFGALKRWAATHRDAAAQANREPWRRRFKVYRGRQQFFRKRQKALQKPDPEPQPSGNIGYWDGRQVAGWMVGAAPGPNGSRVNWLAKIQGYGWSGGLYSGYRSPAYSASLCQRICGAPQCPGVCAGASSNHSGLIYPGGAIDVVDWPSFERANVAAGGPFHNALPNDRPHRSVSGV